MSKRRKAGDEVWLMPTSGFVGNSHEIGKVSLLPDSDDDCMLDCGDDACSEWDVWSKERQGGLYHVSECRMLDAPYEP